MYPNLLFPQKMEMSRKSSKSVEEGSSNGGSWRNGSIQLEEDKDQPRPPTYNPEDYAAGLKKFSRRVGENKDESGSKQNEAPEAEMSLRQFTGVTELLTKLKTDLRVAYPSFVQEFIGDPLDGVTLLLDMLKTIQQSQSQNQGRGASSALQRRILLDEHACLLCLKYCLRCQDAPRRFASSPAGLFTIAACFMSNANKSRILALELLTKVCEHPEAKGHVPVSEAMSTMRLRFGEPVRFRFLVGMLNGACLDLICNDLKFINAFVETSPNIQTKFYIQAELDQAGFKLETLYKNLPCSDVIKAELERWERNFIDVESILIKSEEAAKEVVALREKVAQLENTITMMQEEKLKQLVVEKNYRKNLKDVDKHSSKFETDKSISHISIEDSKIVNAPAKNRKRLDNGDVTPAEDEGISSSEHEDIEVEERVPVIYELMTLQNDTIVVKNDTRSLNDDPGNITVDEVMNDFQKIINDAEKQTNLRYNGKMRLENGVYSQSNKLNNKSLINNHSDKIIIRNFSEDSKIPEKSSQEALILEEESDIVPSYILPQPPSRCRSLYLPEKDYDDANPFFDDDEDDRSSLLNSTINLDVDFGDDVENHDQAYNNRTRYNLTDDTRARYTADMCEKNNRKNDPKKSDPGRARIKRSDTFHNIHNEIQQKFYDVSAMINRRGSFDGLFHKPREPRIGTSKSSASSDKRLKSKSLDRIEDGIERFIDIVVTSDKPSDCDQCDGKRNNCCRRVKKPPVTKPIYFNDVYKNVSRIPSRTDKYGILKDSNKAKSEAYTNVRVDKSRRTSPALDGGVPYIMPKIYVGTDLGSKVDKRDPSGKKASESEFILKRGNKIAGLYSNQYPEYDHPAPNRPRGPVNRSPSNLKSVDLNYRRSTPKLADTPSGLY
ncbi:unnamed protein product [Bemisia tabaci]|uniref:GBD/FH3 domain-containing protein n=1 Tax=Bemisia tabaci TaxID=7038 RepID=A0A9P0CCT2_BEMTA|nr:unnamed protein product [Bemisia tabaci]